MALKRPILDRAMDPVGLVTALLRTARQSEAHSSRDDVSLVESFLFTTIMIQAQEGFPASLGKVGYEQPDAILVEPGTNILLPVRIDLRPAPFSVR